MSRAWFLSPVGHSNAVFVTTVSRIRKYHFWYVCSNNSQHPHQKVSFQSPRKMLTQSCQRPKKFQYGMTGHNKVGNGDLYTVNAAVLPRLSFDSLRRISTSYFHPTIAITMARRVEEPPQTSFHHLIATAVNTAKNCTIQTLWRYQEQAQTWPHSPSTKCTCSTSSSSPFGVIHTSQAKGG